MNTRMTTSLIAGAMLMAGMAASAQTAVTDSASPGSSSMPGNSATQGNVPTPATSGSQGNSSTQGNGITSSSSATPGSCQQMMDTAKPRVAQMSDATKMAKAEKHMTTAQSNLDAGKTAGCESEMKQVMQLLN